MSFYQRSAEKRKASVDYRSSNEEMIGNSSPPHATEPKHMENEKRLRREIANSNERRRMQSINTGFESLKMLVPHQDGEKLSKAAILLHTANHIKKLMKEKTRLVYQNAQYRLMLNKLGVGLPAIEEDLPVAQQESPVPKRVKRDTECSDEGIGLSSSEGVDSDDVAMEDPCRKQSEREAAWCRELAELRSQLDHERRLRMALEERNRHLEHVHVYAKPQGEVPTAPQTHIKCDAHHSKQEMQWNPSPAVTCTTYTEEPGAAPRVPAMSQDLIASPEPKETTTSMSRRNLETIVKAIRHLEGDVLDDDVETMATNSDREEERPSDCCGRVSPVSSESPGSSPRSVAATATILPLQPPLLHAAFPHQFVSRPAVVTYNSS